MAKMEGRKNTAKKAEEKATEQVTVDNQPVEVPSIDIQAIVDRLERLEQENAELKKGQMNVFVSGREMYEGPRSYSYKMWGGVPVKSIKSFKPDPTKDLVYKDQFGMWKSNHFVRLALADGNETEVEVNEFNRDAQLSEKIMAEPTTDNRGRLIGYTFNLDDYGEVLVSPEAIN